MAGKMIEPLEEITELNVESYINRLDVASAALDTFLPSLEADSLKEELDSFVNSLHHQCKYLGAWRSKRVHHLRAGEAIPVGWHEVNLTLPSQNVARLRVFEGTSYRKFLHLLAGWLNHLPCLCQLYKSELSVSPKNSQVAITEVRMEDLKSPVRAGTYLLVTAGLPGTSKEALLDSLKGWNLSEAGESRHGRLAINWLHEYFLRSEKFSQLLLFPDMSAVIEVFDRYLFPDGGGVWQKKCCSNEHKKVWPDHNDGPHGPHPLRQGKGRQRGIIVLQGSVLRHATGFLSRALVNTDKLLMEAIQELEETLGIPVIPVSAHLQSARLSLLHKLQRYKPRWIVILGEGSESGWYYVTISNSEEVTEFISWEDLAQLILEHNESCPSEPVLLVLVLACYGGQGLESLAKHGVHVIGWEDQVPNSDTVRYTIGFRAYMQKLAGAVLVEECGEGVDLMEHHVKEAHAAAHHSIKTEAGPAAHWSHSS